MDSSLSICAVTDRRYFPGGIRDTVIYLLVERIFIERAKSVKVNLST